MAGLAAAWMSGGIVAVSFMQQVRHARRRVLQTWFAATASCTWCWKPIAGQYMLLCWWSLLEPPTPWSPHHCCAAVSSSPTPYRVLLCARTMAVLNDYSYDFPRLNCFSNWIAKFSNQITNRVAMFRTKSLHLKSSLPKSSVSQRKCDIYRHNPIRSKKQYY